MKVLPLTRIVLGLPSRLLPLPAITALSVAISVALYLISIFAPVDVPVITAPSRPLSVPEYTVRLALSPTATATLPVDSMVPTPSVL